MGSQSSNGVFGYVRCQLLDAQAKEEGANHTIAVHRPVWQLHVAQKIAAAMQLVVMRKPSPVLRPIEFNQ